MRRAFTTAAPCLLLWLMWAVLTPSASFGYSVLTHEAIIDALWQPAIEPLLLERFPGAPADALREAHAYAYGGCIIQDMGYYPFASHFFSDLAHYVRSGDFIIILIQEAQDLNEYAFALGALAHYAADNAGHTIAVNRSVAIMYPKLRARYGPQVTYADSPKAHVLVEFGFDVLQVARGRYNADAYHDFIGFNVAKPLLERAFKKTYGLEMKDIFASLDLALGTYRHSVSTTIPKMTRVAWETKKDEIEKLMPGMTREKFRYRLPRAAYEKEWGKQYQKPGVSDKLLAFLFRLVPKIGSLKVLSFKPPILETERLFVESFNATLEQYRALLDGVRAGQLDLPNRDFDTGRPSQVGEYKRADDTYAKLLDRLAERRFADVTAALRENILAFYAGPPAPPAARRESARGQKTVRALDQLRAFSVKQTPAGQK